MRIVRRLVHSLVVVATLVVGATAMAVIVSQTAWFKDWLRGYIERQEKHQSSTSSRRFLEPGVSHDSGMT